MMILIDPALLRTDGTSPEVERPLILDVGRGLRISARIAVTSKGNGTLEAPGAVFRIIDVHDDGDVYIPPALRVRLVDIDGDGYRDLIAFGTKLLTPDDGSSETRKPVAMLAFFNPESGAFNPAPPSRDLASK